MFWGPLLALMLSHDARCDVRVTAAGTFVDGERATGAQIVAACKKTDGALVAVADDAQPKMWPALRRQLVRAHVTIYMRGVIDDRGAPGGRECFNNPLAKGCD